MSVNTISAESNLIDAVRVIEATSRRLAVVVSKEKTVLGTLTDGDIRRGLLNGLALTSSVTEAMNDCPVVGESNHSDGLLLEKLAENNIRSLPIVDKDSRYVRTVHEMELVRGQVQNTREEKIFTVAVIMAGGEGQRLRPFTEKLPKPMIEISGLPLLERQIRRLAGMGIKCIYISVNYLSEVIKDYFGDGSRFDVAIHYLVEEKKLGTAGALSLLPELEDEKPILVMNGDILTTSDFYNLYHFHEDNKSDLTVSAIDYRISIPYGVISHDGPAIKGLIEKPSQQFFCNAGIYSLSYGTLKKIPENTYWNMTDLIELCIAEGDDVTVFPVHEYWSDIGTPEDLEKARIDFQKGCGNGI